MIYLTCQQTKEKNSLVEKLQKDLEESNPAYKVEKVTDNYKYALSKEMQKFNGKVQVGDTAETGSNLTSETGMSKTVLSKRRGTGATKDQGREAQSPDTVGDGSPIRVTEEAPPNTRPGHLNRISLSKLENQ